MDGLPFIGERGFYPAWARGAGRWIFQRTVVVVGQILGGYTRLHASQITVANQVIVWAPPTRVLLYSLLPSPIQRERERALHELGLFRLVCYGDSPCRAPKPGSNEGGLLHKAPIEEKGLLPDKWLLLCPYCGSTVGPDLAPLSAPTIVKRWEGLGRPLLENPAAGAGIARATRISDLKGWIAESDPSKLELAYLGQQLWPTTREMLEDMSLKKSA